MSRPDTIAFVDVETTGLDPDVHEIIEIGIAVVGARRFDVRARESWLVTPTRLEIASPEALAINGYTPEAWRGAMDLRDALDGASDLLRGALIAGHNVWFDWSFLVAGYRSTGLPLPDVDHHRLDTASLAWPLYASGEIDSLSLDAVTAALGIARPAPHRALADACCALVVAERLRRRMLGRDGQVPR